MFSRLASLSSPRTQREGAPWVDAEADKLIRDFGVGAYAAARKQVRDANDLSTMRYWGAVKDAIAQGTSIAMTIGSHAQLCETVAPIEPCSLKELNTEGDAGRTLIEANDAARAVVRNGG